MEICGLVTEKNEPGMNSHVCYYLFAKLILLQYVGELKCFDILLLLSQYLTEFMFFSANKKKKIQRSTVAFYCHTPRSLFEVYL